MANWKTDQPKTLRKVVYALTESVLDELVEQHKQRGWVKASNVKAYGYGIGMLMEFHPKIRNLSL